MMQVEREKHAIKKKAHLRDENRKIEREVKRNAAAVREKKIAKLWKIQ